MNEQKCFGVGLINPYDNASRRVARLSEHRLVLANSIVVSDDQKNIYCTQLARRTNLCRKSQEALVPQTPEILSAICKYKI